MESRFHFHNVQVSSRVHTTSCTVAAGDLFHGKTTGVWVRQLAPSSADVKNEWSYTFTFPYVFMAWCLIKRISILSNTTYRQRKPHRKVAVRFLGAESSIDSENNTRHFSTPVKGFNPENVGKFSGGPGYPSSSGSYPLACSAWVLLPAATLPPA
jgi:hypothetical protein